MAAKSPTMSVKSREVIGVEQFSQRREVFDKHDTVFLPLPSPTSTSPAPEVDPIVTSNHGKTTSNFKRNTATHSSMRESRTDERIFDFRPRKYSDNFTSELNQSDDVDYRRSMTERTRRLSKMRRDFMTSNLHEPTSNSPFSRNGTRASLPVNSGYSPKSPILSYKIESPNLYKFPFAEPYSTPTPVRRVILDLGPSEVDSGKENEDPEYRKHQSLSSNDSMTKIDHQKLFEELVKRYSPQRKPIDWTLPPTKPRVVASIPKSVSSGTDSVDSEKKEDKSEQTGDEDVFAKKENDNDTNGDVAKESDTDGKTGIVANGLDNLNEGAKNDESKESDSVDMDEKNDSVPELATITRQLSRDSSKKPHLDTVVDLTIPSLIEKMTVEGDELEKHSKSSKKVKRKRSFLDKLLGRNKNK